MKEFSNKDLLKVPMPDLSFLNKMEGMTFTQDDIIEVLQFMMTRVNQENKPFSACHENGSWKIIEPKTGKLCPTMHFKKGHDDGIQDFWKCDFCDAIISRNKNK